MLSAAEQAGAGNVPAGVKRMIKSFTEPKMNWRELLRQHIESTIKTDFSWMRPGRKGWHMDSVMPGMINGETTDVVVAIDTSGSIAESMLRDFLSEIKGIMEEFEQFRIHLFTFDTDVYNPVTYTSESLDDIENYEVHGYGGTDFTAIFNYLKNEAIEPQRLVVFTDGYPWGSWGDPDYCDTLWIVHGTREVEAPFGITVYYDDATRH
jgi:predicted metal-dependent peptidase